jgi:peptidoglycan hydrolase-like protein with peptidoglycan-binding domain
MSRFRNIAPLVVAGALVGLAGCSSGNQQAAATPPAAPPPAPAPAPAPPPMAANPMAPSTLRQVQTTLKQDGLYRGRVDGKWGPQTQHAVMAYQRKNGLPATGHLDDATLSSLQGGGAGTSSSMNGGMSGGTMGSPPGTPPMAGSPPTAGAPAGAGGTSGTTNP